jgi:hypothetical protein
VVFDFRVGRERAGPKRFLANFAGILQSDGYAAYDHVGGPKMVHAACWAHARRKFFQTVEVNPEDQQANCLVAQMDKLFEVDQKAREQGLSSKQRGSSRPAPGEGPTASGRDQIPSRGSALGRPAKERTG